MLPIILVILALLVFVIYQTRSTPEQRGKDFEAEIARLLKKELHSGVIRNVLLPNGTGGTTEIDMVFVNRKGIFCIECKSHIGDDRTTVQGDVTDPFWKFTGAASGSMSNPFEQNAFHVKRLRRFLTGISPAVPIYNIVVINNRPELTYLGQRIRTSSGAVPFDNRWIASTAPGYGIHSLTKGIRRQPDVLTDTEAAAIVKVLTSRKGTEKELELHRRYVQAVAKKSA